MAKNKILFFVGVFLCLFCGGARAYADSVKDMETISKVIGFMDGAPLGAVVVDIIYDPHNAESVSHGQEIEELLKPGIGRRILLTGRLTSEPSQASSQIIFVTRGADALYAGSLEQAKANNGLTVSTDEACLGKGCVLVVKTKPSVDIFVSTDAAKHVGVNFASAFSMMVTKR